MFYRIGKIVIIWVFIALAIFTFRCGNPSTLPKNPTFTEHIAPLIYRSCSGCHRDSGVAPFALITYAHIKRKAKTIAKVTRLKIMPPWPADPGYSHFVGENYLTADEIAIIQKWVENGSPEGDRKFLKPYSNPGYRSNVGKPDMVLELEPIPIPGDMKDRFFLVKIPGHLVQDTFLRAIEFVAGNSELVHHFNGHLLLYPNGKKKNIFEGQFVVPIQNGEYAEDFEKLKLLNDDGTLPYRIHSAVNYLPGVLATAYPKGIGTIRLSKNFVFVGNDMHYGPAEKTTIDKSFINLFFTKEPPKRIVEELMLGTNGVSAIVPKLQIKPNTISKHLTQFTVNQSISVLTVNPHLHMLGKSFKAYAIKPNGDTIKLISIPAWDFRWQYFYTFQKMVPIPKGSTIIAEAIFDNTSNNPNNPNSPPKMVGERLEYGGASMRASDEMFQFIINYSIYQTGDENVLLGPDK